MEYTAPAKVNLFLRVRNKREDGYHNIDTIFERISLADIISVTKKKDSTEIICNDPSIDVGENSLLGRCVSLFKKYNNDGTHFHIEVKKRIPVAAGLGGGSSDVAALLRALNEQSGNAVSGDSILSICENLGADVPFFFKDIKFGYGTGRGDKVKEIKTEVGLNHILINPGIKVSTEDIYNSYNTDLNLTNSVGVDKMFSTFLEESNTVRVMENLHNDLQTIVLRNFPVIREVFSVLERAGAKGVLMSGSGPTVFGLFDEKEVKRAYELIKTEINTRDKWKAFLAKTY